MLPPRTPKRKARSWPLRMALRIVLSLIRSWAAASRIVKKAAVTTELELLTDPPSAREP